jgi:ppGpp synthetase/RelA/SpoT-type nucleotidyltranferase
MQFRVLYVVLWAKINHSPNYKQGKKANNPVSKRSLKIGATKKNFT